MRTFLQAKRIEAAAKNFTDKDTLLVIIGDMHKHDIEQHLSALGFTIFKSSNYSTISIDEIRKNYEVQDAFAIASFNLLGVQARTNVIDSALIADALNHITKINSPEAAFFHTNYLLFKKEIASKEAINKYHSILQTIPKTVNFTWTGVKNRSRLDSYFDPFGNMTVWQRIHLELAREYFKNNDAKSYNKEKELLMEELKGMKKAMLQAYWKEYVEN